MGSETLHVDDTPVPVLAPGTGKTKTGRLWTYVRDERPFAGARPPAALFFYSPDRKGEHPRAHLQDFRGVIHADGYAGFKELFAGNRITEAACWAHVRRKFFDVHAATASTIAKEALDRIGDLYGVEKTINGCRPMGANANASSDRSRSPRRWPLGRRRPCAGSPANPNSPRPSATCGRAGRRWCDASTTAASPSTTTPPSGPALCRDRPQKYLFAGSDAGGRRAAALYSLIESAKLNGLNPQHYLADVLARIADHPARQIAELLPWNWQPARPARAAA